MPNHETAGLVTLIEAIDVHHSQFFTELADCFILDGFRKGVENLYKMSSALSTD
jgi:hypothetical protein